MTLPQSEILAGPEKAVLFLLSLEEEIAAPIVNELSIGELRKLRGIASSIREVNPEALDEMFHDFLLQSSKLLAVPNGGMSYLKELAISALGARKASEIFDPSVTTSPLRQLEKAHPDAVAALLEVESPQLVAAIVVCVMMLPVWVAFVTVLIRVRRCVGISVRSFNTLNFLSLSFD